MAKELREGELCLPSDFLCDDDFFEVVEESRRGEGGVALACLPDEYSAAMSLDRTTEIASDEEDDVRAAELARQMAYFFLHDGGGGSSVFTANTSQSGVMAGALQYVLRGWSASKSSVSSRPALSLLEQHLLEKHEELDCFSHGQETQDLSVSSGCRTSPDVIHQQRVQAAQLKRLQLMRQHLFAAWARQSKARGGMGMDRSEGHPRGRPPLGLSPSARRPLHKQQQQQQQQQPGSGMRAVFLKRPDASGERAGTGVFLPRSAGDKSELRKKPACSTVLVPERVAQLLKLNLEEQRHPVTDHEALVGRRNAVISHQKRNHHLPRPTADATHEIGLPQEWTY